jgi:hypothetical protein
MKAMETIMRSSNNGGHMNYESHEFTSRDEMPLLVKLMYW